MKSILASLLTLFLPLSAQDPNPKPANEPTRDELMEALMNAANSADLEQAISQSKKAGLPEQMLLEARFVFLVNENNLLALAALAAPLEKQLTSFSADHTLIFSVKEDFESIVQYTKALGALQNNDHALFKKHITEAFWLSPDHASQFAPHIKSLRIKQAMSTIRLDLNRSFTDQRKTGAQTTLASIKGESPALLLHFWSPWVRQSILAMPEIDTLAKSLISHNIPVASLLLSGNPESRKDANLYLKEDGRLHPGHWLIDTQTASLSAILRISSFPTVVLVDTGGKILFNGDPADPELWKNLAQINPAIKQPMKPPVLPGIDPGE